MAFLLSTGFGGQPKDAERAMELEEKAALSGFIPSNMALGYHYIDTDCERALLFYKVRHLNPIHSLIHFMASNDQQHSADGCFLVGGTYLRS